MQCIPCSMRNVTLEARAVHPEICRTAPAFRRKRTKSGRKECTLPKERTARQRAQSALQTARCRLQPFHSLPLRIQPNSNNLAHGHGDTKNSAEIMQLKQQAEHDSSSSHGSARYPSDQYTLPKERTAGQRAQPALSAALSAALAHSVATNSTDLQSQASSRTEKTHVGTLAGTIRPKKDRNAPRRPV